MKSHSIKPTAACGFLPAPPKNANTRPALLPLGAMVVAMAFQLEAHAQTAPDTAVTTQKDVHTAKETILPTITVKEARDREAKGYQGGTTRVGKTAELAKDIPQSVTVISGQLMFDRGNDTLKEALRNIAGLTFNAGEGGRIGDNINIRGYSAANDLFLDNIRDNAQYNRDLFNIEQVDVLRGSASMLFGRGSTGGVVNQVSKKPFLSNQGEAQVTVGTDNYKRGTVDDNKVLGENTAVRINAMKTDADSYRDTVSTDRTGLAASISTGIGTRDEFNLSHMHLNYDDTPDFGTPWVNKKPMDVPVSRFYGRSSDFQKDNADITTASWVHRFDKDTTLTTALRYSNVERELHATQARLVTTTDAAGNAVWNNNSQVNRGNHWRGGQDKTYTLQSDFATKFDAGGLRHNFVAGGEYAKENVQRWTFANNLTAAQNAAVANAPNSAGNPNPDSPLPAGYLDFHKTNPGSFDGTNLSLYAQDTVELTKHWKVLGGVRFDKFRVEGNNFRPVDFNVWSYRTGLMYQPFENHTYYASYGTSFNPTTEGYTANPATSEVPPEKNRNIEIGAKWDLAGGDVSLRTSIFRSEKTNERNIDLPTNPGASGAVTLSGARHTDGIEIEAAGRITPNWEVFGSAAWFRAEIDKVGINANASTQDTLGKRPGNTPTHAFSLWTTYKLGGGWKIGGGLESISDRTPADNYVNIAPAYTRFDALIAYEQENYYVKLNINNVLNEKIYDTLYRGFLVPGTSRTAQLSVGLKF